MFPNGILIVFIVSMLCCCMGFKRFVWFMSVGYGLSAAGIGACLLIMALVNGNYSVIFLVQCLLLIVYGFRLGGFLLIRELKNAGYKAKLAEVGGEIKPPVFVSVVMWLFCGSIYVCQTSPAFYRLTNGGAAAPNVAFYIGTAMSALGVLIEALADKQKGQQKLESPNLPAMKGLYKMCRCPNYFGEMLFWAGVFVSGFGTVKGAQWVLVLLGFFEIEFVMISGAKRVETRHIKHYGKLPEYNQYADKTPLLLPLIPIYHMTNPEKIAKEEAAKAAKKAQKAGK